MAGAGATARKLSRSDALDNISAWDTDEVLCLLRKNGLEECCKAVAKRQIDGDELLHLTYGKLALWKNDLTRPLIGQLWAFVEELNKMPENYLPEKTMDAQQNNDYLSDDSWGTDFEDEEPEGNSHFEEVVKPSQINNRQMISQNNINRIPTQSSKRIIKPEEEETYVNCESCQDEEENMYMNFQETTTTPPPPKNVSRLHNQIEKTLANKEIIKLNEELKRKNGQLTRKPTIGPKPETLPPRKISMTTISDKKLPQKSFLHTATNQRVSNEPQRRMAVPPPPEPNRNKDYVSAETKRPDKELPKPPAIITNFDLVANLPTQTEDTDDEYEALDEHIEHMQKISRVDSKQSLHSGRQGSVESVYKPPSATSHEEEEEEELYESITEAPEDNDYVSPIQRANDAIGPPPLPAKPSPIPPSSLPNRAGSEKFKQVQRKERSPEKKSATLPHVGSNTSLSTERATRPLPPPPERQSYVDKPWFHNVTREQAVTLIKDQGTGGTKQQDGYFLLRPSTTHVGNPLTLVLWYKDRVYNVPVRKRRDNRYALGSAKVNEPSFTTIEEIVMFYMREELVLHTGGVQTGSTRLTDTPPK